MVDKLLCPEGVTIFDDVDWSYDWATGRSDANRRRPALRSLRVRATHTADPSRFWTRELEDDERRTAWTDVPSVPVGVPDGERLQRRWLAGEQDVGL